MGLCWFWGFGFGLEEDGVELCGSLHGFCRLDTELYAEQCTKATRGHNVMLEAATNDGAKDEAST